MNELTMDVLQKILSDIYAKINQIIETNNNMVARLTILEKQQNPCYHMFEKRTDVVYLTFPIKYLYRCSLCGIEKTCSETF